MTKYTFLLPVYKAKYLDEMLRSIQSQTYTEFKVIISDDCSPEDIYSICKPYFDDPRFSYRRNDVNMGRDNLVAHWNILVEMCDTEYLIMASDDDIYDVRFLEEIDKLTIKYPKVDLLHARAKLIDRNGELIMLDAHYEEIATQLQYLAFHGYTYHIECLANYVYKTAAIKAIHGFHEYPLAWCADASTNSDIAKNGVATTNDILFSFRYSDYNITRIGLKDKAISRRKFHASVQYTIYIRELLNNYKTDGSKYQQIILEHAKKYHKAVCTNSLTSFHVSLSFADMLKSIKILKRMSIINGKMDIYIYIKKWIKYNLHI